MKGLDIVVRQYWNKQSGGVILPSGVVVDPSRRFTEKISTYFLPNGLVVDIHNTAGRMYVFRESKLVYKRT